MIGSHNTMTYLKPKYWIFRLFTSFWRCQKLTIDEQLDSNVKFFDLRVIWNKKKYSWEFAHGLVNLKFEDTHQSVSYFINKIINSGAFFRIILEKGNKEAEEKFDKCFYGWSYTDNCLFVGIKKNWKVLYNKMPELFDFSFVPFNSDKPWYKQLSWKIFKTPKSWAKKHSTVRIDWTSDPNSTEKKEAITLYDFATQYTL